MNFKIGNSDTSIFKIGSASVDKIFLGETLVYTASDLIINGGDPSSSFSVTVSGGDASTTEFINTIDGGNA